MGKAKGGGDLPFPLGATLFGSGTPSATKNTDLVGKIFYTDDTYQAPGRGSHVKRGNRDKVVMAVRNGTAINLLPGRLVQFSLADGPNGYYGKVTGYTTSLNDWGVPVDEFLPAAGVAPNDIFYVVISGTAKVLLPVAGGSFGGDIAIGDAIVAATGAGTSAQSTAGRIGKQSLASVTDAVGAFASARNLLGTALSAATTGQTAEELLISVEQRRIHC